MHEYGVRDVEKLLRLPRSTIRSLIEAGFVSPARGPRNAWRFSFQDLIVLRTAEALAAANVPRRRITRSVRELRRQLPESMPLSGLAGDAGPDELFVALRDAQQVLRLALAGGALVSKGTLDSANLGLGGPFSVAALDVGGDGLLDLVVGEENPGTDRVIEFPRTVAGFQPAELLLEPLARPVVDATGDMDGNGFEDLAIAQLGGTEVFLLAGDAAGLSSAFALDFGGETTSLLFEDLDGDGLSEAVATVFLQESIQVRRALAPFDWDEPTHYNVGIGPRAIGVIRLPGDANADLLCANAQDLSLLLGNGQGAFRCATGASTGTQRPILVDTADLDADGDQDAVAITRFQETLVFLENQGGELATVDVLDLQPGSQDDSGFLALSDVDLDGDVDVIVTVYENDELRVYRNQGGPASFVDPAPGDVITVGDGPLGLDLGDLDDDGFQEYKTRSSLGYENVGWKDSGDASPLTTTVRSGSTVFRRVRTASFSAIRWTIRNRTISPPGGPGVTVHQEARVFISSLDVSRVITRDIPAGFGHYFYVIAGTVELNGEKMTTGDAAKIRDEERLVVRALEPSELLTVEVQV